MKISLKILLINFAIVFTIIVSSGVAFYSIMYKVLSTQQSKFLLGSSNNFIYALQNFTQKINADFNSLQNNNYDFSNFNKPAIDFVFTADSFSNNIIEIIYADSLTEISNETKTVDQFIKQNPFVLINKKSNNLGLTIYYGVVLSGNILTQLSEKIGAEIALVWNGTPAEYSDKQKNQLYFYELSDAYKQLKDKTNFSVYLPETHNSNLIVAKYKPPISIIRNDNLEFLIFSTLAGAANLRTSIFYFLIIIGTAGIFLSVILTMLFTEKIRNQISELSAATAVGEQGILNKKVAVKSKDELGDLAKAFNVMTDEIEKNRKLQKDYSEFIALINKNPKLNELSSAIIFKLFSSCNLLSAAIFVNEENNLELLDKINIDENQVTELATLSATALKSKSTFEYYYDNRNVFLAFPIIYNNNVLSVVSAILPSKNKQQVSDYFKRIVEQLAIGFSNALALKQLEILVRDLKKLNIEYEQQNTELKSLHQKLKEKAAELELQKEKAEESTKLKSQFLASMSHELRTPMNSVLGLTELLLEDQTISAQNRERLQVVLNSGTRLMNLINDILDLSKIEAGRMEVHNENFLLEDLIKDASTSVMPLVVKKNIEFKLIRNLNTAMVINADRGKITQVLINLLGNAIKFTEEGFVELCVKNSEDYIVFDVADTGIGISEADQKIIFEEFRQVDGTQTKKYSGTGLGLAICKRISNMLNGSLTVKSQKGKGSVFSFKVPYNLVRYQQIENQQVISEQILTNPSNPILIIDDDENVRYTISQYLISKGYESVEASNAKEGLELAKKIKPYAITLDVMLPDKDGWTVINELKQMPETKNIPVIMISVSNEKNLGYGLGAFDYLVKPVNKESVYSTLDRLEKEIGKKLEKIILVDDDEFEFEKFKDAFANDNVIIEYIKNSKLAFNKIKEVQPDLVVIDLMMPGVDGITLSHKLKSSPETKHIPIIISSAKDLSEDEKDRLINIVEEITVKTKGHPLDVLKVVRDRLNLLNKNVSKQNLKREVPTKLKTNQNINNKTLPTVLIVDDDKDTRFTLNEIVKECNCNTVLAQNGFECLKELENLSPDLILLDIMMPGMDGFQTLKKIRENTEWASITVFAVTARAMAEDKQIIFKNGFDDYIPKPVNRGELSFKIEKLFISKKAR